MNTIIEKIRAEVNRLWNEHPTEDIWDRGYNYACEEIMSFLSDLEKSEKPINPTIEKIRALINMQIRREELNFASLGGGGQTMNIGALEWVLKQLDTLQEQPVKNNALFDSCLAKVNPETREEVRKNIDKMIEQPVDLEKEIENYAKSYNENGINLWDWEHTDDAYSDMIRGLARHFYELGKQSKEQPLLPGFENEQPGIPGKDFVPVEWVETLEMYGKWKIVKLDEDGSSEIPNDLEEAAKAYADDTNPTDSFYEAFKDGALWMREQMMKELSEKIAGAYQLGLADKEKKMMDEWLKDRDGCFWDGVEEGKKAMREQMMKEAVEGEVVKDINNKLVVTAKNVNLDKFKFGDKVKIIIVKED